VRACVRELGRLPRSKSTSARSFEMEQVRNAVITGTRNSPATTRNTTPAYRAKIPANTLPRYCAADHRPIPPSSIAVFTNASRQGRCS